jgi:hypothetical protein
LSREVRQIIRNAYSRIQRASREAQERFSNFLEGLSDDDLAAYVRERVYGNVTAAEFVVHQLRRGEAEEEIARDIMELYGSVEGEGASP